MSDRKRLAHLVRSTRQHEVLTRLVCANGWRAGVEVGVLKGKTLFAVLDACPDLKMYAVDQWRHLDLRADENAETYVDHDMDGLRRMVETRAKLYCGRCLVLDGDSVEMAGKFDHAWLDFAFLDGDHTERGIERDIRAWATKIRPGGMLLGHDCHWSTVRRVIDRLCPGWTDEGEAVWSIPVAEVLL